MTNVAISMRLKIENVCDYFMFEGEMATSNQEKDLCLRASKFLLFSEVLCLNCLNLARAL